MFLTFIILLAGCKSKKASLSGEEEIDYSDFVDFFPEVKFPYQFNDTHVMGKDNDSLLISQKVFTQFVPDSILTQLFGKTAKVKIYPMGKAKSDDTYLFAKIVWGTKKMAMVVAFDKNKNFVAAMPILQPDQSPATKQSAVMDVRQTFSKIITRKNADGSTSDGKDVYVLNNDAHEFMLIMTDALDDKMTELINPIDTLPRKQKYSADYGSGKQNLVSIRDNKRAGKFTFFVHFEKNNGECTGEIKGEAVMKSATDAEYHEPGDPCGLKFTFSANAVKLEELGGCGSRRGLRCSFNGSYTRKKEIKPKPVKTKKTTGK
ncbi:MAG: hypothetical protein ABI480_10395 [Chitinophagaceae bacterium]